MKKQVTKCKMCLRGIVKPSIFCTPNCEEHWKSGFRVPKYALEYDREWYLSQKWEWWE